MTADVGAACGGANGRAAPPGVAAAASGVNHALNPTRRSRAKSSALRAGRVSAPVGSKGAMSHIAVRRIIEGGHTVWGQDWYYEFRELSATCNAGKVAAYCQRLSTQYSKLTSTWTEDSNSEWISRVYFAVKMALSSSVMAMSLDYARCTNLRVVESYLEYYMVLNCMRAVMLTMPSQAWTDGSLMQSTHSKTIQVVAQVVTQLDKACGQQLLSGITHLKALREYISYRGPSSGGSMKSPRFDSILWSRFLLELAQLQSEILEKSIIKQATSGFALKSEFIAKICRCEIDGLVFQDSEDVYRMGYLKRKHPLPTNIMHMMSEGHVEDYFGSWCAEEQEDAIFNPDVNWRILFDVP
ncbi:MAG: hypothetical protein PHR35_22900 [Kiritimatiellae bacterium]|nr:hypothetical protein [Kiritimatiellia bacterium]